ncbi:MAG: anhydro-N-acetylmuramic acid kinase [Legionellales bacterium]
MTLYIGLMSGTSMDGIDAAVVELPENRLVYGITKKYSDALKQSINSLLDGSVISLASVCQLNTLIGREFGLAVNQLLQEAQISFKDITAIGSHGQTVCHDTSGSIPYTLQLGCGHTISALTGITVIADFRTRDLVNGGQGAPFAPLYHQELFAKIGSVAVVNIGGIANISLITPNQPTRGWDIGPGNCLMDAWIYQHQGQAFDADGLWAAQGRVIPLLLTELLSDSFFALPAPKSIGKEYFSLSWLAQYLKKDYKPVDVQATLLALTAHSIADTLINNKIPELEQLYLCGGGTHNRHLHAALESFLPDIRVKSSVAVGADPDYLEAMMFAWLASQTLNRIPVDLSSITGSNGPEILGAVYWGLDKEAERAT